jgi:hypothetical protein
MKRHRFTTSRKLLVLIGLLVLLDVPRMLGDPSPAASAAFLAYSHAVEWRLAQQHSSGTFLAASTQMGVSQRLRGGELIIERVAEIPPTPIDMGSGALLHHWRGTAFAAGAKSDDFERLMRDFSSYPQHFAPQVQQAKVLRVNGNRLQTSMRVKQKHVITVVMDADYDVDFERVDVRHGYSISRSTHVAELDGAMRPLDASHEHGFLWRLNTYWSYEERDGGLYLQIEAVSLSRSVPRGLDWVIRPYVERIPRESMEFTLRSAVAALKSRD